MFRALFFETHEKTIGSKPRLKKLHRKEESSP